jgi:hypothetical protein
MLVQDFLVERRISKMKKLFYVYIILLALVSCSKRDLSPLQYVKWVENESNGLKLKKGIGDHEFSIQYKPLEYIALMEKKDERISENEVSKRTNELKGMEYYTFRISSTKNKEILTDNIGSENEYYERLQYCMSPMQDDINLVKGTDTIPCALFHFERTYGMTHYCNFVLGFPTDNEKDKTEDRKFIYNDRLFGNGPVILGISAKNISNIPNLSTFN